jgi:hypothetical protein
MRMDVSSGSLNLVPKLLTGSTIGTPGAETTTLFQRLVFESISQKRPITLAH